MAKPRHDAVELAEKHLALEARLAVFKELRSVMREMKKTHSRQNITMPERQALLSHLDERIDKHKYHKQDFGQIKISHILTHRMRMYKLEFRDSVSRVVDSDTTGAEVNVLEW